MADRFNCNIYNSINGKCLVPFQVPWNLVLIMKQIESAMSLRHLDVIDNSCTICKTTVSHFCEIIFLFELPSCS